MKKTKKIISILMIMLALMTSFIGINNKVQAVNLQINKADLYSKGEVVLFNYKGIGIGVEVIVHKKDGIEYPAYCVNKGRQGITKDHTYSVDINKYINNNGIWKAVANGYPFKSIEELGCKTMEEAYAATKMAVYDAMYHYDIDGFTVHKDTDSSRRTVQAIKKIITNARNSNDSRVNPTLQIKEENQLWQVDENDNKYVSKKYSVIPSAPCKNYHIEIQGKDISEMKITNLAGKQQNNFEKNEMFKVMIPISELENNGDFNLFATSELTTYPVLYGETPNPNWQNFAVVAGTYEMASTSIKQQYYKNKTEIEVVKQDGDKKVPLDNAIFSLYNSEHKLAYQDIITNKDGIANVDNLLPGTYYLKEIQAPNGYYGYDKEIKIDVELNQKVVVTVDNYIIPEQEREEKPQDEDHFSVGEKKAQEKLPQTGF